MKKNVKCNLLKSLFLTGTVLTISACNEEFKSVNKRDKELLKNTKAKINSLKEIKDFDDCLDILKTTRDFINQISDRNTKNEVIKYIKDNIKFIVKNNSSGGTDFYCGNFYIYDIDHDSGKFYRYCSFAKNLMDIVGCEDDYKIDLSVYNGPLNEVFEKLKVFPKEYFSTAKTFSFDRDIIEEKFTGGCSDKLIQYLEYSIKKLFYIYDLNPNLIDKNFEVDKVIFNDVRYNNNGLFDLKFYYKDFHDMDIKNVPISNFLKKFKIEDIYRPFGKGIGYNEFVCSFICSPYHSFKFSFNVEKFDVSLLKNIEIKRKRTVFWNNGIDYDKGGTFWYSRMWWSVDDFIENLIFLQDLKDCNLINVKKADIDFGEDGNSLNLNGHDLLKFKFATRSQCNPFFIEDVYHTLSKLFRIFEVDCSVELENYHIKLTKDGESHLYELNGYSNSNLKKV